MRKLKSRVSGLIKGGCCHRGGRNEKKGGGSSYAPYAEQTRVPLLPADYFLKRDPVLSEILNRVESGESLDTALWNYPAPNWGERFVEYAYFVQWISKKEAVRTILDVGCTLNNEVMAGILDRHFDSVWFCNPSLEKRVYCHKPVYYHLASLSSSFPNGETFDLISCLSTIEHIGYDNSQYGAAGKADFTECNVEPFIEAVQRLVSLLKPQGRLLVSVPYGHAEVLVHPATGKRYSQVFSYEAVEEVCSVVGAEGIRADLSVWEISENGWASCEPKTCDRVYAEFSPGAGAVAMIKFEKLSEGVR